MLKIKKMIHLILAPILVCTLAACAEPGEPLTADFLLENVNIVPMNEETILEGKAIAVRDGRIVAILDSGDTAEVRTEKRVDGQGRYVMPGLADMHVHVRTDPQSFFDLSLANGITTVHNMGIADGRGRFDHTDLRAAVEAGTMVGPRYLVSGPQLESDDVTSLADVDAIVDEHLARGYDTMKVHGDLDPALYDALIEKAHAKGIRITGHAQHMRPLAATLRMDALEHAEEFLYTSRDNRFGDEGAGGVDNYLDAYYANLTRLGDDAYRASIVRDVAQSGIYLDPTLIIYTMLPVYIDDARFEALKEDPNLVYLPPKTQATALDDKENEYRAGLGPLFVKFLDRIQADETVPQHFDRAVALLKRLTLELHEAGVPLLLGSDVFGALVPGFATHQELELMVDLGLTPYEALQTGTVNVAAYLGESADAGTVELGKRADFILLRANPLADVANIRLVEGVFTHGHWYGEEALDHMLDEAKTLAAKW